MKYSLSVLCLLLAVVTAHLLWPHHQKKVDPSGSLKVAGCIYLTARAYEDAGEVVKSCKLQSFTLDSLSAVAFYKVRTDVSRYRVRVVFHWGWAPSDYNVL